jgi:hypothetical protein
MNDRGGSLRTIAARTSQPMVVKEGRAQTGIEAI